MADTPTIEAFNPTQFAIESLIAAGAHEQAAKLALKVSKQAQLAPAPAATTPDPDRLLTYKEMRSMSVGEMGALQHAEPHVVERSLRALEAAGERHNLDTSSKV
jgi:hypothetical protein